MSNRSMKANYALLLIAFAQPVIAMRLAVLEEQFDQGPIISSIRVDDALGEHPNPHLRLDPTENPKHAQLIRILSAGMPFGQTEVRDQVAQVLAEFPAPCKGPMGLALAVGPMEHIDRFSPGVKDKRRVLNVYVGQCLGVDLPECSYDQSETGADDFGIRSLLRILRDCRDATNAAVARGVLFSDAVYGQSAYFPAPTLIAARSYFYNRSSTLVPTQSAPKDTEVLRYIRGIPEWNHCYDRFSYSDAAADECEAGSAGDPAFCSQLSSQFHYSQAQFNECLNAQAGKRTLNGLECSIPRRTMSRESGLLRIEREQDGFWNFSIMNVAHGWLSGEERLNLADCRRPERYAQEQRRVLDAVREFAYGESRVARDHADFDKARLQIAAIRHQTTALAVKGDNEAAYFRGCLNYSHTHELQEALGSLPKEADPERPYACGFYAASDHRAIYIDGTGGGVALAQKAFEEAAKSKVTKLAARAHWNLAVLWLEAEVTPVNDAAAKAQNMAKAINALNEAKRLDPAAFAAP